MTLKDLKTVSELWGKLFLLLAINVFAYYAIFWFLMFARVYLNALFVDHLRWEGGRIKTDLTQFYRAMGLVLLLEWLGLLYGLYRLNKWYCDYLPHPQSLVVTIAITSLTSLLISFSAWRWFSYIFQHI
jgi:hypothetical protein